MKRTLQVIIFGICFLFGSSAMAEQEPHKDREKRSHKKEQKQEKGIQRKQSQKEHLKKSEPQVEEVIAPLSIDEFKQLIKMTRPPKQLKA
ncbi:hypothetical protein [Persicobacter diffluens]|uniref:Uncharacterized protein n=1 Tax=Persicobacter diffluens TaxID=981 RepID=A0AAN4VZ82_9BACT|nr:hypothetical protein PEDI_16220 [Persicobacter diffluens]